jgi:hypothetical protein
MESHFPMNPLPSAVPRPCQTLFRFLHSAFFILRSASYLPPSCCPARWRRQCGEGRVIILLEIGAGSPTLVTLMLLQPI